MTYDHSTHILPGCDQSKFISVMYTIYFRFQNIYFRMKSNLFADCENKIISLYFAANTRCLKFGQLVHEKGALDIYG